MNVSCAVLAGGESRRMGRDKALLNFDGRALVVRIAGRLASVSDDVFVVAKSDVGLASLGVRVYHDGGDVKTPLMGSSLRSGRRCTRTCSSAPRTCRTFRSISWSC